MSVGLNTGYLPYYNTQAASTSYADSSSYASNTITSNYADSYSTASSSAAKDGKDDGKISFWEKIKNVGKGIVNTVVNTVTGILTDPKKLLLTAGAVALSIVCPPAGVAMAVAGGVAGAVTVGKGIYKASTAQTDSEAEQAWQEIGGGGLQVGLSVVGAKAGLNKMAASGKASNVLELAKSGGDAAKVSNLLKHPTKFVRATGKDVISTAKNTKLGANVSDAAAGAKGLTGKVRAGGKAVIDTAKDSGLYKNIHESGVIKGTSQTVKNTKIYQNASEKVSQKFQDIKAKNTDIPVEKFDGPYDILDADGNIVFSSLDDGTTAIKPYTGSGQSASSAAAASDNLPAIVNNSIVPSNVVPGNIVQKTMPQNIISAAQVGAYSADTEPENSGQLQDITHNTSQQALLTMPELTGFDSNGILC